MKVWKIPDLRFLTVWRLLRSAANPENVLYPAYVTMIQEEMLSTLNILQKERLLLKSRQTCGSTVCAESGKRSTEYCPTKTTKVCMVLPEGEEDLATDDSVFSIPGYCNIHGRNSTIISPTIEDNDKFRR